MRWILAWVVVISLSACSDDGVPMQPSTTDVGTGSTGAASTGDETQGTTATTDTNVTSVGETTGPTGSSDGSGPGGSSSESGAGSSGSSDGSGSSESGSGTGGPGNVGDDCTMDSDCMTRVCWDFEDYDPLCFGAACSGPCETDEDCVELLTDAGADDPEASRCGKDGRCTMVSTGFGAFACAAP